jgi:ABC-2 type transport system permease protein
MAEISWGRRFYWCVRRELWEIPAVGWGPVAAGIVVIAAHVVGLMRGSSAATSPANVAIGAILVSTYVVAIFYSLDTLYSERKDRSIMFWKSLPVSDSTALAAKASIPFLVAPLIGFAVTEVTLVIMMLLGGTHQPFLRTSVLVFYHIFAVHALWWAPFFGWLFLVSAWTRRTPLVWAVLPAFAVVIVERMTFNTSHFLDMLKTRAYISPDAIVAEGTLPFHPMTQMTPLRLFSDPGLWIGLGVAALFFAIAVRLRRHHGPI